MQVSIWEKESFYAHNDIVIIGSGFVGLWSAFFLKQFSPSLRITIVDRGIIPTGASTRNAGFACFGSLTELSYDAKAMGEDAMLQIVEMRYKGLKRIRKIISKKVIDYSTCGGYELITHKENETTATLKDKMRWLNKLLEPITGDDRVFNLSDKKIKQFGFAAIDHLVENKLEGYLHAGKLCQQLMLLVQSLGVTILNSIEILSFERKHDHLELRTNLPVTLTADQILICTNAFAKQLIPDLDVIPARGQILLTSPIDKLSFKGTFHADEGFYYFRDLGNRVLLGGARNKAFAEEATPVMNTSDNIQNELERYLSQIIIPGKKYTIESRWSGIMGMGNEKKPIVRQMGTGVFCAVRMSGMGVALAPVVGEKVAKMMRKL